MLRCTRHGIAPALTLAAILLGGAPGALAAVTANDAWQPLGNGVGFNNTVNWWAAGSGVNAIISGNFTSIDGVSANHIVRWDGSGWNAFGSGLNGEGDDLAFNGGTMYVIGKFTTAGGNPAQNVAAWNGSAWSALGAGVSNYPYAATMHGGELYVGGGNPPWVRKWNGTAWIDIATGGSGWIYAMDSFGGNLVIAGDYGGLNGVPGNAYLTFWNGTSLSVPGGGIGGIVGSLLVDGSTLYASGGFNLSGGAPAEHIASWNGSSWSGLGSGLNSGTSAMIKYQGGIFAVGGFTTAGGNPAAHAAFWDGSTWSALGSGTNGDIYSACLTDRGIVVAGPFSQAGGKPVGGVAIYNNLRMAFNNTLFTTVNNPASGTLSATTASGTALAVALAALPQHGNVTINNAATGAYTYTPTVAFAGTDSFSFIGSEAGGTTNTAYVTVTVQDATFPTLVITTPATSPHALGAPGTVVFSGTASDDVAVTQVSYTLSGATTGSGNATGTTAWSFTTPTLNAGSTTVTVTASDAASQIDSAAIVVTVPDTIAPVLAITTPATSPYNGGAVATVAIAGTASDNVAVTAITYSLSGATTGSGSVTVTAAANWAFVTPILTPGATTITVTAVDAATNSSTASVIVSVTALSGAGSTSTVSSSCGQGGGLAALILVVISVLGGRVIPGLWHRRTGSADG